MKFNTIIKGDMVLGLEARTKCSGQQQFNQAKREACVTYSPQAVAHRVSSRNGCTKCTMNSNIGSPRNKLFKLARLRLEMMF